jgi:hypothetical protein
MGDVLNAPNGCGKTLRVKCGPCNVVLRPFWNAFRGLVRSAATMIGFKQIEFFDHTGTRLDYRSDRRGRKPGTPRPGVLDSPGSSVPGMRGHSGQRLPDVPLCRANRAHGGRHCNVRYLSLVGVHSCLYRSTDRVERNECVAADDPRLAAMMQAGDVFYPEANPHVLSPGSASVRARRRAPRVTNYCQLVADTAALADLFPLTAVLPMHRFQ